MARASGRPARTVIRRSTTAEAIGPTASVRSLAIPQPTTPPQPPASAAGRSVPLINANRPSTPASATSAAMILRQATGLPTPIRWRMRTMAPRTSATGDQPGGPSEPTLELGCQVDGQRAARRAQEGKEHQQPCRSQAQRAQVRGRIAQALQQIAPVIDGDGGALRLRRGDLPRASSHQATPQTKAGREAAAPGTRCLATAVNAMPLPPARRPRRAPRERPVRPARSSAGSAPTGVRSRRYGRRALAPARLPGRYCRACWKLPSPNSETWIRPSSPCSSPTKAPKRTTFVTTPSTISPTRYRSSTVSQGSGNRSFKLRATRPCSRSTERTFTSTDWPQQTASEGCRTLPHESSDTWIRPSTPPSSTKTPKRVMLVTTPETRLPGCNRARSAVRQPGPACAARCESTRRPRSGSNSITLRHKRGPYQARQLFGSVCALPGRRQIHEVRDRDEAAQPAGLDQQPAAVVADGRQLDRVVRLVELPRPRPVLGRTRTVGAVDPELAWARSRWRSLSFLFPQNGCPPTLIHGRRALLPWSPPLIPHPHGPHPLFTC